MRCGFEAVSFAYAGKQIVSGLDLALPWKGSVCLFGPSGCGKTTALRLLAGLERPDAGRIVGMKNRRTTMLFQENRLLPWSTVLENVALAMGDARNAKPRAMALLEAVGLPGEADAMPDALSGGMCRRAALARALAHDGEVFLLDEPFKELDADTAARMRSLVVKHTKEKLLVLVTHDLSEAKALCDTVWACSGPVLRIEGEL